MARPKIIDLEVRRSVSSELNRYLAERRGTKTAVYKALGISRQTLHNYLKGDSTPSLETLWKLSRLAGISLNIAGLNLQPEDLKPRAPVPASPVQEVLPFEQPVVLESGNRKLTVGAKRAGEGLLELVLRIKVAG